LMTRQQIPNVLLAGGRGLPLLSSNGIVYLVGSTPTTQPPLQTPGSRLLGPLARGTTLTPSRRLPVLGLMKDFFPLHPFYFRSEGRV
jgi:hypothetical protein